MWKLKLPPRNGSLKNIDKALTKKNGVHKYPISQIEIDAINDIYKAYDKARGVPSIAMEGGVLSITLVEAMKKAYNEVQIKGRLSKLRDKLLLLAKTCPCCGILVPDELDHYLPKDVYGPLAIYSRNLIPYCHKCNNKKRTLDGKNPKERFINVYYDLLPETDQFLFADVKIKGKGLVINLRVKKIGGISDQLFEQMSFQMRRVNLNKRLRKELNLYLSSIATYIQSDYEVGSKPLVIFNLKRSSLNLSKQHGVNHWRAVVMSALAEHDAFCDGGFYEPLSLERPATVKSPSVP